MSTQPPGCCFMFHNIFFKRSTTTHNWKTYSTVTPPHKLMCLPCYYLQLEIKKCSKEGCTKDQLWPKCTGHCSANPYCILLRLHYKFINWQSLKLTVYIEFGPHNHIPSLKKGKHISVCSVAILNSSSVTISYYSL